MPLTVRQLRQIVTDYEYSSAEAHITALNRQKIGYRLNQVYCFQESIMNSIVLKAIMNANEPLDENDCARVPEWMGKTIFDKFISKIRVNGNYIP